MQNNKPELSIVVPGIRNANWIKLVDSVRLSLASDDFEVIFIGPYSLPKELEHYYNIKYLRDWGSAGRCQQLGAILSEGDYLTFCSDDCLFEKNALRDVVSIISNPIDEYCIVTTKYGEGGDVLDDWRYTYGASYPSSPWINPNWIIFNSAIYRTDYFKELGGFNCEYDVTCIQHAEMGARCWRDGAKIAFYNKPLCHCSHLPGRSGDHFAVHDSQVYRDEPLFRKNWNQPEAPPIKIDLQNWRSSDKIWKRRFG